VLRKGGGGEDESVDEGGSERAQGKREGLRGCWAREGKGACHPPVEQGVEEGWREGGGGGAHRGEGGGTRLTPFGSLEGNEETTQQVSVNATQQVSFNASASLLYDFIIRKTLQ